MNNLKNNHKQKQNRIVMQTDWEIWGNRYFDNLVKSLSNYLLGKSYVHQLLNDELNNAFIK